MSYISCIRYSGKDPNHSKDENIIMILKPWWRKYIKIGSFVVPPYKFYHIHCGFFCPLPYSGWALRNHQSCCRVGLPSIWDVTETGLLSCLWSFQGQSFFACIHLSAFVGDTFNRGCEFIRVCFFLSHEDPVVVYFINGRVENGELLSVISA